MPRKLEINRKFMIGDRAKVIDDYTPHFQHIGVITDYTRRVKSKRSYSDYTFECDCGKTRNFRASSLEKVNYAD